MTAAWNLACPDWAERLTTGRSMVPDLPLDLVAGNRAVAVFNKLRLADVHGTPTMAQAGGDWFRDIVRALFGSMDPITKQRMIREVFVLVPKKNSKSTSSALLMLTALLLNWRPNATLIMTAPVQEVAGIAYDAAAGAIELDPVLKTKLRTIDHLKTIEHRVTKAELKIMSFDPAALTGQKVVAALIDELHVVAKMAKAFSAIRQLRGGMLPFPDAFLAFITTQSEEPPAGVFKAELTKARAIRDGTQSGAMLPILYEFPRDMQQVPSAWRDPANWHMVTPNAGRSIEIARLVEEMATAEKTSEGELRAWASQHLNVEIGLALGADSWAAAEFWEDCEEVLDLEGLLERSEVVAGGIDGGGLDDLLSLSFLGREKVGTMRTGPDGEEREHKRWLHWHHAWAQQIVLERRKEIAPRLLDFAAAGELTIVEQIGQDIDELVEFVEIVEDSGLLDRIGVDQAGIGAIVDALTDKANGPGLELDRIIGIPQGWKLVGAIKTTERKVAAGELRHGGQAIMAYAVGNAKVEPRGNAVIITKQAAGVAKIDPLMSLFDAVAVMSMNPAPRGKLFQMFVV